MLQHYGEEVLIFFVYAGAIVCSEAVGKKATGHVVVLSDIFSGWADLLLSLFIAMVSYVALNKDSIKYGGKARPMLGKRIYDAALKGVAWREVVKLATG